MSSPVLTVFLSFVQIDRTSLQPIYLQLAQQTVNAIQRGYLLIGTKLPGSRALSEAFAVHRKTVIAMYNELEAQGWVEVRPSKGTFVVHQHTQLKRERPYQNLVSLAAYPAQTGYSFRQSSMLDSPYEEAQSGLAFNDGQADIRLSALPELSRWYSAVMKRKLSLKQLVGNQRAGNCYFREQWSNYLNFSRGLHIAKDNLLVTRSVEMSLYLVAKVLLSPGDVVLVGNLSLFSANMVFQESGARMQTIPMDEQGMDISYIRTYFKPGDVRMVYLTPQQHYPTTVSLSAERRMALLQLAREYGFVIVEDDYDGDFQYEQGAIMPLASGDVEGMVVYVGSFGKALAPTFRTGFVLAPDNLIQELHKYQAILDRQGDMLMEQALAELIEEGEFHRQLKKSLKHYKDRRDHCCALLQSQFQDVLHFQKPSGGLAVWTVWEPKISLGKLARFCQSAGLFIPQHLLYQNQQLSAMRIGFGHLDRAEMTEALAILRRGVDVLLNATPGGQ